jgi:hypothetical protein
VEGSGRRDAHQPSLPIASEGCPGLVWVIGEPRPASTLDPDRLTTMRGEAGRYV